MLAVRLCYMRKYPFSLLTEEGPPDVAGVRSYILEIHLHGKLRQDLFVDQHQLLCDLGLLLSHLS